MSRCILGYLYTALRSLLLRTPAEAVHTATVASLGLYGRLLPVRPPPRVSPVTLWGLEFANPIGLAAGLDKNASAIDGLARLGFGFLELGTVTPRPQPGNPRPRLFRLRHQRALINRLGFNNNGVESLVLNLLARRSNIPIGVNIGCNRDTPPDQVVQDYCLCLRALWPLADYITINISSPNTPGLRDWQHPEKLAQLLSALHRERDELVERSGIWHPLLVKLSPDLEEQQLEQAADRLGSMSVDGVVATNTTNTRPEALKQSEPGGLSGAPLRERSNVVLRLLRERLPNHIPIVGVGGVDSPEAAQEKLDAGASLVQLYTGLIYVGPALIMQILSKLSPADTGSVEKSA